MAIKTILTEPNKILRQVSKPVIKVGIDEQKLMDDMLETMYSANGIGLAAIQIGVAPVMSVHTNTTFWGADMVQVPEQFRALLGADSRLHQDAGNDCIYRNMLEIDGGKNARKAMDLARAPGAEDTFGDYDVVPATPVAAEPEPSVPLSLIHI